MFPPKGSNPYGQQQTYGGQQSYGQIPGSSGFSASAATGGVDGSRFGARVGQGATGQYGGPYASVYGTQQVGGLGGKGPASSSIPNLPEPSKFSSGSVGSSMARPNDDYMAVRGYGQKLDQYGSDYTLERRMYGDHSANLGRRDGLTDLDRRYPEHISGGHQIHDRMEQGSSMRHPQLLKGQLQSGSDIRQADYFAGRSAPIHQGSQDIGAYGRVEADHRNLSILGTAPYGGQQSASLLGGAPRTNIDSLSYGQGSSSSGYGMGLPPGRDYASGKGLLHPSSDSDYRDSILSRVHPGISMVDECAVDRVGYRRELDLRDEERRRDLLLEREKERERELRDLRDRERERDRERLRERERERELERERERLRERRMKERERDRKHPADSRREHTPPRTPGDRRRSSSVRAEKPLRRLSPRRDAVHRHRSPVKEIKREYICKVLPFRLVDNERDYLSLTKRYPRLAIAPDFSKIVLNWTKESLNLSLHTPVSLEHGIHEVDDSTDGEAVITSGKTSSTKISEIIWNAKVLLMSGMSNSAFADITSLRSTDERVVHLNNILKFAVFKRDRSLFAIGGPWNAAIDGGDPAVDSSCLIQTAIRHVKELVQVDLSNCTQWNRFLEIHYNRVGKDGLFSHKEITVLFVPNLSKCLPSVDLWKKNWIAYRKSRTEKEQLIMKEKSPADASKQKQGELFQGKSTNVDQKEDADHSATENMKVDSDMDQQGKDGKENLAEPDGQNLGKVEEQNTDKVEAHVEKKGGGVEGNTSGDASVDHGTEDKKPMKKKVIKKVVKVVRKKSTGETSADKSSQEDKNILAETTSIAVEEQVQQKSEDAGKEAEGKKPGKKKVIRRVIKKKVSASARDSTAPAETSKQAVEGQPEKNDEGLSGAVISEAKLEEGSKTPAEDISKQNKEQEPEEKGQSLTVDQKSDGDKVKQQEVMKQKDLKQDGKNGKNDKTKDDKEKKSRDQKMDSKQKSLTDNKEKKKSDEPPKHPGFILQAKRSKDSKVRSTSLSLDGLLDYTANDLEESVFELSLFAESFSEMLQHKMGCVILSFLEKLYKRYVMKRNQRKRQRVEDLKKEDKKTSEKRPKTNDETLSESTPSNQGESVEMIKVGKGTGHSAGQPNKDDETQMNAGHSAAAQDELVKEGREKMSADHSTAPPKELIKQGEENMSTDNSAAVHDEPGADEKMEDEEPEYEEDPEEVEVYEDDDEMDEATAEEPVEQNEDNVNDKAKQEVTTEEDGNKNTEELESESNANMHGKSASGEDKQSVAEKSASGEGKQSVSDKGEKAVGKEVKTTRSQKGDSAKDEVVDKELLQAFRYFDQNRAGYLKVDDLRCILHNLGKFLSNRDVKDLVQIALVESNSARDNRIIYTKLAKKVDL